MRSSVLALAATALVATTGVDARTFLNRRNAHANAHAGLNARGYDYSSSSTCPPAPCSTYVTTTWVPYNPPQTITHVVPSYVTVVPVESKSTSTSHVEVTVTVTPTSYKPVPTPEQTTCPTPGVYTIPAKTITLTETETVCVPTSTVVPAGTHTLGQTVTVVSTATTVTCPYATTVSSDSTVYTTIHSTTIVCPSAGTYTYGGLTTTVTETATCEYPVTTHYAPGTYTAPEQTVTVTKTSQVVVCPYAASSSPAPAPTTTAPAPVYNYVAPSSPAPSSPAPKPTSTPHASYTPSGELGAGPMWGITYSPYSNEGGCKTKQEIDDDITDIHSKGFKTIRVYSTECEGLIHSGAKCEELGMKIIIGIFIKQGYSQSDLDSQLHDIITWGKFHLLELIVIGNESVYNGWISSADLATLITSYKAQLVNAGCHVPVTTAETLGSLQENKGLCQVIDVVGANIHPFFNPQNTAENAGSFLQMELQLAEELCGKPAYCLEAGWPSAGQPNGAAVPGIYEQKQALESIYSTDKGKIVYFTYTNDQWKGAGAYGVEQSFGCGSIFPM